MTGEITKLDKQHGLLTLKTPEATLDLHFPPPAVQDLSQGDRITVELGLRETMPSASPHTGTQGNDAQGATKSTR
jgi:hypothetical protein